MKTEPVRYDNSKFVGNFTHTFTNYDNEHTPSQIKQIAIVFSKVHLLFNAEESSENLCIKVVSGSMSTHRKCYDNMH